MTELQSDFSNAKIVLIDKETGELHRLNGVVRTIEEATESNEQIKLRSPSFIGGGSFKFRVKLRGKRKWRKMLYPLSRPTLMKRQYISKREMIRAIHKMSEEAKVGHIAESDEQLMQYSAKHLWAIMHFLSTILLTKNQQQTTWK